MYVHWIQAYICIICLDSFELILDLYMYLFFILSEVEFQSYDANFFSYDNVEILLIQKA